MHGKSLDRTQTVHNKATFCRTRHRAVSITSFISIVFVLDFKGSNYFFILASWYCHTISISIYSSINSEVNGRMRCMFTMLRHFGNFDRWNEVIKHQRQWLWLWLRLRIENTVPAGEKTRGSKNVVVNVDVKITTKILNAPKNISIHTMRIMAMCTSSQMGWQ